MRGLLRHCLYIQYDGDNKKKGPSIILIKQKGDSIMKVRIFVTLILVVVVGWSTWVFAQQKVRNKPATKSLRILRTEDFVVNGRGDASAWEKTVWEPLHLRAADGHQYLIFRQDQPNRPNVRRGQCRRHRFLSFYHPVRKDGRQP